MFGKNKQNKTEKNNNNSLDGLLSANKKNIYLNSIYTFITNLTSKKGDFITNKWLDVDNKDEKISYFVSSSGIWIMLQDKKTNEIVTNIRYAFDDKSFFDVELKGEKGSVVDEDIEAYEITRKIRSKFELLNELINKDNEKVLLDIPSFLKNNVDKEVTKIEYDERINNKDYHIKVTIEVEEK